MLTVEIDGQKHACIIEEQWEDAGNKVAAATIGPDTILASNTSSIPITAIASRCQHPERVGGMHFFNPVPLMRLVEIIPGLRTARWVTDALIGLGRRMAREPVLCTDSPAFLVNHVGRGFVPESQRILTENIAGPFDIDRILTGPPGFKMGPFMLADMVGIDVQHGVMESVFAQFYGEPAFAPMNLSALRAAGGLLGERFMVLNGDLLTDLDLPLDRLAA